MNASATIFALALASNQQPQQHLTNAFEQLRQWGRLHCSASYLIPCRDGIGADYWNAGCLLYSDVSVDQLQMQLKQLEQDSGRVRPSHQISLDIDLIAWGSSLQQMQFNPKKCPLAEDVKIPLAELWPEAGFFLRKHHYPIVQQADEYGDIDEIYIQH